MHLRGGGAKSPDPVEPAVVQLEVAAELQQLLRKARKRKLEILEHEAHSQLEAASVTLGTEQTSWEREAAPSPSSDPTKWLAATTAEEDEDGEEDDELPPPPDISDQPAAAERSE